ncbi:MAG: cytidine deaminase [Endomicrobia bacterium]|nr:cytidine deaminase [Endomicrobiia bacterium]MCL2798715.1 cytidine deaminase [Endomicrobiia bacterium]
MKETKYKELMEAAREAADNFYAPYSGFAVGSAVLSSSGKIYIGANVENASYGLTNCAERSALFNAFSHGERKIEAVAVWTKKSETFPCGACRQVILELAPHADIIVNGREDGIIILSVSDLLPFAFDKQNLK